METIARLLSFVILFTASVYAADYAADAAYWRKVLEVEKEFPTAVINLAYAEMMLQNYERAAELYMQADSISESLDAKAGAQWALLAEEKYGDSIQWGKAALAIDPANFWVRRRLGLAYAGMDEHSTADKFAADLADTHGMRALSGSPAGQLTPYYQNISFAGSSYKTSGFDAGAFALWNFNSGFNMGGGYARNQIANPKSSDGYNTNEFRLVSGFTFSDLSSLTFTSHVLSSNYSYLDRAVTVSAAYRTGTSGFSISGDALIFPAHGGAALSPQYNFLLGRYFNLGIGAQVQAIGFTQTTKLYGAATGSLTFCASGLCLGVGGLVGQLYTPLFDGGAVLTYSLDQLTSMAYTKLSWRPMRWLELTAAYTYSQWSSFTNESPTSNTISFSATGSLW